MLSFSWFIFITPPWCDAIFHQVYRGKRKICKIRIILIFTKPVFVVKGGPRLFISSLDVKIRRVTFKLSDTYNPRKFETLNEGKPRHWSVGHTRYFHSRLKFTIRETRQKKSFYTPISFFMCKFFYRLQNCTLLSRFVQMYLNIQSII